MPSPWSPRKAERDQAPCAVTLPPCQTQCLVLLTQQSLGMASSSKEAMGLPGQASSGCKHFLPVGMEGGCCPLGPHLFPSGH